MKERVAIIGAGGHAKVAASTAMAAGFDVVGFYVTDKAYMTEDSTLGIPVRMLDELDPKSCPNAVLGIGDNKARKEMSQKLDFNWLTLIHPFSWVHPGTPIGKGTVIFAGAIVQPGARIGSHVIINTKSSVDHDTFVGDFAHVSVAHLAGGASIEEGVFQALHSVVLPKITVGAWAIVGAGAVVTKNVQPNTTVVGIPAKPI
jgi:acetyltransferase EpsM